MSLSNMLLEDVLAVLGRCGSVTLRKGTNDVSATPGRVAGRGWTCEISLAGYHNSGGTRSYVNAGGATAKDAADACLARLEKYLSGTGGREDRQRYEQHHETMVGLFQRRVSSDCFGGKHRDPGPLAPLAKIEWGD
jgi:hypothetical protein